MWIYMSYIPYKGVVVAQIDHMLLFMNHVNLEMIILAFLLNN